MTLWHFALLALGLLGALYGYYRFWRLKVAALKPLRVNSRLLLLRNGAMEYGLAGDVHGTPLLVLHGGGGGYEQGLLTGEILSPDGDHWVIAPSRPGARRTPLATGRNLNQQSDALYQLLDALGVEKTIVVAVSAGGMSALQFAQDYPQRCEALVLISALSPLHREMSVSQGQLRFLRALMATDATLWAGRKLATNGVLRVQGSDLAALSADNPLRRIVNGAFPSSDWRDNIFNDVQNLLHGHPIALDKITVPALLIHGTDDSLVSHEKVVQTAQQLPNASLVTIDGGSHLLIGTHSEQVRVHVREFLTQHVQPPM